MSLNQTVLKVYETSSGSETISSSNLCNAIRDLGGNPPLDFDEEFKGTDKQSKNLLFVK